MNIFRLYHQLADTYKAALSGHLKILSSKGEVEDKPSPSENPKMMQFSPEWMGITSIFEEAETRTHPIIGHSKTGANIHLHPSKHTMRKQIEVKGKSWRLMSICLPLYMQCKS